MSGAVKRLLEQRIAMAEEKIKASPEYREAVEEIEASLGRGTHQNGPGLVGLDGLLPTRSGGAPQDVYTLLTAEEMVFALVRDAISARLARGERPNAKARRRLMRAATRRVLKAMRAATGGRG